MKKHYDIIAFADGGCSGNGTPDAKGYASVLIMGTKRNMHRIDLPNAVTNNQAELGALWSTLDLLSTLMLNKTASFSIFVHMDSNFALNTVFGDWKIKNKYPVLQSLRDDCKSILHRFDQAQIPVAPVKEARLVIEKMLGH